MIAKRIKTIFEEKGYTISISCLETFCRENLMQTAQTNYSNWQPFCGTLRIYCHNKRQSRPLWKSLLLLLLSSPSASGSTPQNRWSWCNASFAPRTIIGCVLMFLDRLNQFCLNNQKNLSWHDDIGLLTTHTGIKEKLPSLIIAEAPNPSNHLIVLVRSLEDWTILMDGTRRVFAAKSVTRTTTTSLRFQGMQV